jgi:TPP-dependent pyruvate/acetoin dehydrogenase alpha subunit
MTNNGKRQAETVPPAEKNGFSLISNEKLMELYTNLLKCHRVKRRAAGALKQSMRIERRGFGEGCDAARVGVAADLRPEDSVVCLEDDLLAGMLTGVPLATVLSSLESGDCVAVSQGRAVSANEIGTDAGIESQLHYLLGVAIANKTRKNGRVGVVFSNEGSGEAWRDALRAADEHKLPIIFVLREGVKSRSAKGADDACNVPRIGVDGNDAVAVYRVAHESVERARCGRGPTLIDCKVFRLGNGHESDNSVENMEQYLRGKGWDTGKLKRDAVKAVAGELDGARVRS